MDLGIILTLAFFAFAILVAAKSVAIVPQSDEYVVERFGKYRETLSAGINLLIPFLDRIEHKVVVLERQLDAFDISVITRDNVEIVLETTVFFRVIDAAKSVYRIRDVPLALRTTAESIIRSAAGKLELDDIQSSRQQMNDEILKNLRDASEVWGLCCYTSLRGCLCGLSVCKDDKSCLISLYYAERNCKNNSKMFVHINKMMWEYFGLMFLFSVAILFVAVKYC